MQGEEKSIKDVGQEKKEYESPRIEEHDALDKTSGCGYYSRAYVSGYGYYW